jgi:hypothetical protein
VTLAAVRALGAPRSLRTSEEIEDFEQDLVDQYLLAGMGASISDDVLAADRSVLVEFARTYGRPIWTATPEDADEFLVAQRKQGRARMTLYRKAVTLAQFFDFLIARYQTDIHRLTGHVVIQPVDEFNRPSKADYGTPRVPPSASEVVTVLAMARKLACGTEILAGGTGLPGCVVVASCRVEDHRDSDVGHPGLASVLGPCGKLHVRYGKGSRGRGPKTRLVPAINEVDALLEWWLGDIRHQFGDDWDDPDAPLLPSERRDPITGWCRRVGDDALRSGLAGSVARYLPPGPGG